MKIENKKFENSLKFFEKELNILEKYILELEKDIEKTNNKHIGRLRSIQNSFKESRKELKSNIKLVKETLKILKK